jgi:hypothetical protein
MRVQRRTTEGVATGRQVARFVGRGITRVTGPRWTQAASPRSAGCVFDGTAGRVFVLPVNTSLAGEGRTRGLHPEARYEFKIHHLDDGRYENLT